MQNLRVFTLGDMKPTGDESRDDTRYVRQTHTSQLVRIIEGAAKDLARIGEIDSADCIYPGLFTQIGGIGCMRLKSL